MIITTEITIKERMDGRVDGRVDGWIDDQTVEWMNEEREREMITEGRNVVKKN